MTDIIQRKGVTSTSSTTIESNPLDGSGTTAENLQTNAIRQSQMRQYQEQKEKARKLRELAVARRKALQNRTTVRETVADGNSYSTRTSSKTMEELGAEAEGAKDPDSNILMNIENAFSIKKKGQQTTAAETENTGIYIKQFENFITSEESRKASEEASFSRAGSMAHAMNMQQAPDPNRYKQTIKTPDPLTQAERDKLVIQAQDDNATVAQRRAAMAALSGTTEGKYETAQVSERQTSKVQNRLDARLRLNQALGLGGTSPKSEPIPATQAVGREDILNQAKNATNVTEAKAATNWINRYAPDLSQDLLPSAALLPGIVEKVSQSAQQSNSPKAKQVLEAARNQDEFTKGLEKYSDDIYFAQKELLENPDILQSSKKAKENIEDLDLSQPEKNLLISYFSYPGEIAAQHARTDAVNAEIDKYNAAMQSEGSGYSLPDWWHDEVSKLDISKEEKTRLNTLTSFSKTDYLGNDLSIGKQSDALLMTRTATKELNQAANDFEDRTTRRVANRSDIILTTEPRQKDIDIPGTELDADLRSFTSESIPDTRTAPVQQMDFGLAFEFIGAKISGKSKEELREIALKPTQKGYDQNDIPVLTEFQTMSAGFTKGVLSGIRDQPIQTGIMLGVGFAVPLAGSGIKAGLGFMKIPQAVSKIPIVGTTIATKTEPAIGAALGTAFAGSVAYDIAGAEVMAGRLPSPKVASERFGRVMTTEVAPLIIGAGIAMKTVPKIGGAIRTYKTEQIPIQNLGFAEGYPVHGGISPAKLEASFRSSTLKVPPKFEAGARANPINIEPIPTKAALPEEAAESVFAWHASPSYFKFSEAAAGSSELPGLYTAPILEGYYAKVPGMPSGYKPFDFRFPTISTPSAARIETAGIKAVPQSYREKTISLMNRGVGQIPAHRQSGMADYISKDAEKGILQMPLTKGEYEAVLPEGTKFTKPVVKFSTKIKNQKIPIVQTKALSAEEAATMPKSDILNYEEFQKVAVKISSVGKRTSSAVNSFVFSPALAASLLPSRTTPEKTGQSSISEKLSRIAGSTKSVTSGSSRRITSGIKLPSSKTVVSDTSVKSSSKLSQISAASVSNISRAISGPSPASYSGISGVSSAISLSSISPGGTTSKATGITHRPLPPPTINITPPHKPAKPRRSKDKKQRKDLIWDIWQSQNVEIPIIRGQEALAGDYDPLELPANRKAFLSFENSVREISSISKTNSRMKRKKRKNKK